MNYKEVPKEVIEDICYDYLNLISIQKLSKKNEYGAKKIRKILVSNNIVIRQNQSKRAFTKEQEREICEKYLNEKTSCLQLSKIYKVKEKTIRDVIHRNGIKMRTNKEYRRLYTFNENYFDDIDNEHNAYWLGFLYADGFLSGISKSNKTLSVGVSLGISDKEHLEKLKKSLNATHPINEYTVTNGYGKGNRYCRLILSNDYFFHKCIEKGLLEHKSERLIFPKNEIVPSHLIHHFIRGYFDGDGCLTYSFDKHNSIGFKVKIVGTKEFLKGINKHIPINKEFNLYKRRANEKNNYTLEIGGNKQVKVIIDYLFRDSTIYLNRKFEKVNYFYSYIN